MIRRLKWKQYTTNGLFYSVPKNIFCNIEVWRKYTVTVVDNCFYFAFFKISSFVFQLQSKRELFFKSDTVSGGGVSATGLPNAAPPVPPMAPSALKDALAKRSATLPDPPESGHHEPNGTAAVKLSNSVSVDTVGKTSSMPPQMPAPPVPTTAPPPVTAPLRSTENIMKVEYKSNKRWNFNIKPS